MSAGRKSNSTTSSSIRASRPNADAARKWVAEETRAEAKEVFTQHMKETSNLDVLSRCKKLNELLSSDVLKGKGNSTAQLKEILGILHAGPKRPAFLDKPPVTATAGKRGNPSGGTPEKPASSPRSQDIVYPDTLLSLLEDEELPRPSQARPTSTSNPPQPFPSQPDDVDDLINLLNESWDDADGPARLPLPSSSQSLTPRHASQSLTPRQSSRSLTPRQAEEQAKSEQHPSKQAREEEERQLKAEQAKKETERLKAKQAQDAEEQRMRAAQEEEARKRKERQAQLEEERQRRAKEAQEEEERQRRAREAQEEEERQRKARQAQLEEEERLRKQKEEAERRRKAEEEEAERRRAAAAAEALRLERLRRDAALCIQSQWRAFCARRLATQRRRQLEEQRAAAAAACVLQAALRARQAVREHRALLAAAGALQCAIRAWRARRCLQRLRVEAFVRKRAASIIQRAFRAYRARGYTLGPLRVPTRPPTSQGLDGSALLAMQLRLRSAVDTRLAPECLPSIGEDDSARQHRTVVTHRERVRQVSASERNRRSGVSERAIMVASEHRDNDEALAIARQGLVSTASSPAPSLPRVTTVDGAAPPSRSSSRPSSQGAGRQQVAAALGSEGTGAVGLRPSSSQRRISAMVGSSASPL